MKSVVPGITMEDRRRRDTLLVLPLSRKDNPMTMYPARVVELPNPAMQTPAVRVRPPAEPLPTQIEPLGDADDAGSPDGPAAARKRTQAVAP